MNVAISFCNSGGELDSRTVSVDHTDVDATPVKDALFEMLAGIDLHPGDRIRILEVD